MLYVMTERWPAAARYRNAFEIVKESVFEPMLSSGSSQELPTRPTVEGVSWRTWSSFDATTDPFFIGLNTAPAGLGQMMEDFMGGANHGSQNGGFTDLQANRSGPWIQQTTPWDLGLDNLGTTIPGFMAVGDQSEIDPGPAVEQHPPSDIEQLGAALRPGPGGLQAVTSSRSQSKSATNEIFESDVVGW